MAEPTGPPQSFLVGHWWQFERDRLAFLRQCHSTFGDTTRLRILFPTLLIHNPADIQHVLITHEANYRKSLRAIGILGRRLFANGLLTRTGAPHRSQRRLVQPSFQRHAVNAFVSAIQAHIDPLLQRWRGQPTIDLTQEMDRFSESVLICALLGELDGATFARISATNRTRRRFINHAFRTQFPLPELLPTPLNWQYQSAVREQSAIIRRLVHEACSTPSDSLSILAGMTAAQTSEGARLSEDGLFDEVWELLTAGYETTREALTWALYLLAQHPAQAARLRQEAEGSAGAHQPYAESFFSEALRLYPPAWMFVRVALNDDTLPSGVPLRAGTKIFLCPYTSHRDERFFPNPEQFDPDRFLPCAISARPKFAYFPFGAGPRVCVAEALARLQGAQLLTSVARAFDLSLPEGQQVEPSGQITLRPKSAIFIEARPSATYESGPAAFPDAARPSAARPSAPPPSAALTN